MTDQEKRTGWRRVVAGVGTLTLTSLVVVGAGFAVALGSGVLAERAEAVALPDPAEPTPVEVERLSLTDGYTLPRRFVGQVEAAASVVVSFELPGRLAELPVEEGARVTAGQLLARLDTAILEAERDRLRASQAATAAQLDFAEARLARVDALRTDGHVSVETVDQARATRDELASRIREIEAAIASVAINLEKSELRAPFDGRIGVRNVDGGEALGAGAPVLTVIETALPRVRIGLPLSVDPTALGDVRIDVDGASYPARLEQVRPDIDPVTRTRTALFALDTDTAPAFGQTATLNLDTQVAATGTWVPLDALQEGAAGGWTVLVVEEETVRLAMVEVLHADEARAFVTGTFPAGAQMIRTGAHRVVPGQAVRVLTTAE